MTAGRTPARVRATALLLLMLPLASVAADVAAATTPDSTLIPRPADAPPDLLQLHHSSETVRLTPGETSSWDIRLHVLEEHVDTLTMSLGNLSTTSEHFLEDLSISASACSVPFTENGCPAEETDIVSRSSLDELTGTVSTTLHPGEDSPAGVLYVRVDVACAARADVRGDRLQVVFAATAGGAPDEAPDGTTADRPPAPAAHSPRTLADTGAAMMPYLALGAGAVVLGFLLAGFARRTPQSDITPAREVPDIAL